jgi:hypothetical protein
VCGPSHLGGLGLQSLWVAQGIDQICLFVKSWRANNIAGQFLRVALAWAQHNSGVGTPILENPTIPLPYLETQWISSLRTALTSLGCKIQVDYSSVYPLQRQHDAHLMDVFRERCTFKPNELKSLFFFLVSTLLCVLQLYCANARRSFPLVDTLPLQLIS